MSQNPGVPQFWSTARRDFVQNQTSASGAPSASSSSNYAGNGIGNSSNDQSSPPQPLRHIHFFSLGTSQSVSGVGVGGMNPQARTTRNNNGPQSAERPDRDVPDENTMHMPFYPPPATATGTFSPPIRNSLSSHASERGRLLGQARAKNHDLQQKISELEHTILVLQQQQQQQQQHQEHHNGGRASMNNFHSPNKPFLSPPVNSLPNSPDKTNIKNSSDYVEKLEAALQIETQRREAVEKKTAIILKQQQQQQKTTKTGIESDPLIVKLLGQASKLLEDCTNSDSINNQEEKHVGTITNQERMHDYNELVTAFHSEQQSHGDIDGEEFISREDVLWLLNELKLAFGEIYLGYAEGRSREKEAPLIANDEEWKECLASLVNVVKKATKDGQSSSFGTNENQPGDDGRQSSESTHALQDEVSTLNQRLASFAAQHKETCLSLNDDMEAMKRHYQEQLSTKSQCIENLESKISEQEDYIAQTQNKNQKDQQWINEEKQKLILNKEGTANRIRYLEGMLRAVQMELKETKTPQGNNSGGSVNNSNRLMKNGLAMATSETGQGALSPPVFMRDLTVSMQAADFLRQGESAETEKTTVRARNEERKPSNMTPPPATSTDQVAKLLEQIKTLSNSLADSETRRANLLEDFQQERKKYILQYKQMSELLKLLIEGEKINHT